MRIKILHIILLTSFLLTFSCLLCIAQKTKGNLTIRQKKFIERNDSLFLSMDIVFSGRVISSAYGLKLVPVLKAGSKSIDLPYMLINGKQRASYFEREKALLPYGSKKLDGLYSYITQSGDYNIPQFIRYNVTVPYQTWMKDMSLLLRQLQVDCCSETLVSYDVVNFDAKIRQTRQKNAPNVVNFASNTSNLTQKRVKFCVNYVKPDHEPIKTRIESISAYVNYPPGKSHVIPSFAANVVELQKVRDILLPILTNKIYTLNKITINGCASPEGLYSTNEQLSRTRTYYFREYIKTTYNLKNNQFSLFHIAEDWDKLVDLIDVHPVPDKARVLEIIKKTQVPDEREEKLKRLSGGIPYQFIYQNLYPELRRLDISVQYSVKKFEDRDIIKIYQERPEDLSLDELFLLANKFKSQTDKHKQILETAAGFYPNEPIANINAAAATLLDDDTDMARIYLAKVSKDRRAYNNMGVYFLKIGDTKKAKEFFKKAKNKEAIENLKQLKKI